MPAQQKSKKKKKGTVEEHGSPVWIQRLDNFIANSKQEKKNIIQMLTRHSGPHLNINYEVDLK